jgi:hypothetical protein
MLKEQIALFAADLHRVSVSLTSSLQSGRLGDSQEFIYFVDLAVLPTDTAGIILPSAAKAARTGT